jgi:hypothetical protein
MKSIWIHNTGYSDIMYCTSNRNYVEAHKWIWEPIILGFQIEKTSLVIVPPIIWLVHFPLDYIFLSHALVGESQDEESRCDWCVIYGHYSKVKSLKRIKRSWKRGRGWVIIFLLSSRWSIKVCWFVFGSLLNVLSFVCSWKEVCCCYAIQPSLI